MHLYLYLAIIVIDFINTKRFNLLQTWLCGFVFIILSEMIEIVRENYAQSYLVAIIFYLASNNFLLLGYLLRKRPKFKISTGREIIKGKPFIIFAVILILAFIAYRLPGVAASREDIGYGGGSSMGNGSFLGTFMGGVGTIVPAFIGLYFKTKRKPLVGFLIVLPVFLILISLGSRYKMLFTMLPYLITCGFITLEHLNFKRVLSVCLAVFLLSSLADFVKFSRRSADITVSDYLEREQSSNDGLDFPAKVAANMSPEGVVFMAELADHYFSTHNLHYGKESGFVLYYWIPRALWPSKPTMLDHWLIREYYGDKGEGFSTASGFMGELRADFGRFALIFAFLLGFALRWADEFVKVTLRGDSRNLNIALAGVLYPFVFFFVRSPLTSCFSFFSELIVFLLFSRLYTKPYSLRKSNRLSETSTTQRDSQLGLDRKDC